MSLETQGSWVNSLTAAVFRSMFVIRYLEASQGRTFADAKGRKIDRFVCSAYTPCSQKTNPAYVDLCHPKHLSPACNPVDGVRRCDEVRCYEARRSRF